MTAATLAAITLRCLRCDITAVPRLTWRPTTDPKIVHLKATCPTCASYLKFVPQHPEWLALLAAQQEQAP
jgi:hypothetical protein